MREHYLRVGAKVDLKVHYLQEAVAVVKTAAETVLLVGAKVVTMWERVILWGVVGVRGMCWVWCVRGVEGHPTQESGNPWNL